MNAFAFAQTNPKTLYIGGGWGNTPRESPSQSGIYKTIDGGAHWASANNGLTNTDGTISSVINSLWLDQANPTILLASTEFGGTFKSTNSGATWVNVDRSESTQFSQVGTVLYLASAKGVLKSADTGSTWTVSLALPTGATTVVTAAGATYAGSAAGDVYKLSGASWTKLGHPGTGAIHNLAVDPFSTQVVYANVDDKAVWNQSLYGSVNGGISWKLINCNCSIGPQAIAFSLVTPHKLFLGDDGSGVIFNFKADGNPNPVLTSGVQYFGADTRYIVPVPGKTKTDDACYILMDQGLYFGAKCSSGTAPSLSASVNNTLVYDVGVSQDTKKILAPLQDNGSTSSADGGKTWPGGASGEGGEAAFHPDGSDYCYLAHPDEGLYVSSNGCATIARTLSPGFESVTFDPTNPNTLFAVSGETSGVPVVSKSVDKGFTWKPSGWKFTNPYQVAVAPSDAKSLVVATGTATSPSSLFYTHDGGTTWKQSSGLPIHVALSIYYPVHRFYAAFDPRDAKTVLLADHDPTTDNILMYKSSDGGQTFTLATTFVQPKPSRPWPHLKFPKNEEFPSKDAFYYATRFFGNRVVFNLKTSATTPDVVLTTRFGAYLSTDLGATWTRVDGTAIAHHFIGAAWSQGYLYLASFGQGIVRSTTPIQP